MTDVNDIRNACDLLIHAQKEYRQVIKPKALMQLCAELQRARTDNATLLSSLNEARRELSGLPSYSDNLKVEGQA